jgi:subtilisin family serine protease
MVLKAIRPDGYANYSDISQALEYVAKMIEAGHKIDVVNMSFAGFFSGDIYIDEQLDKLAQMGVILVAGSGNSALQYPGVVGWPARHPAVIAVGGSTWRGERDISSNYGPEVDLLAPFGPVQTLCYLEEYCKHSGTSFSTPQVSLLVAILRNLKPNLSGDEIRALMNSNANKSPWCDEHPDECGAGVTDYDKTVMKTVYPWTIFIPIVSK